jgi:hypothetical protein
LRLLIAYLCPPYPTLELRRDLAEQFAGRGICVRKNIEAVVIELLESGGEALG